MWVADWLESAAILGVQRGSLYARKKGWLVPRCFRIVPAKDSRSESKPNDNENCTT